MKIYTKDPTTILISWKRFIGAILTVVLMMPAVAVSQSSPAPVDLGTSGNFVILTKTGISTTGTTSIVGDIGVSPIDHTAITGFILILDPAGQWSSSNLVVGKVFAADYEVPTPTMLITAVSDMETAYTDAAGRTLPDYTELYSGDLTGQTLTHGLYKWSTGVLVSAGGVTISGTASDVWIFQIAQNLIVANGAIVTLNGGAQASNIFWQVAGQTTLGTTADFKGIILCQTLVEMQTGATLNGRALAQTAVTLDANSITSPTSVNSVEDGLAPKEFALFQNYPNPFNPTTTIRYGITEKSNVKIILFNAIGEEVALLINEEKESGYHQVEFNAAILPSGVYFYQLQAGSFVETKKMILMK
jgi:hypothetical protein